MQALYPRLLFENARIERDGLYAYIYQFIERRWRESYLDSFIFAIPRKSASQSIANYHSPIGNAAFAYTIIIVDPGCPIILVILNSEYSFARHCMHADPPSIFCGKLVAITAHKTRNVTIIALEHEYMMRNDASMCATALPSHVYPIIRGVCAAYGAHLIFGYEEHGAHNYALQTARESHCAPLCCDLCPLSRTPRAIRNFDPFCPNIWQHYREKAKKKHPRPYWPFPAQLPATCENKSF
jgi:hypothetical protein